MIKVQRAVILAAGKGSRLKSLTQDKPKALMLVSDEAAITRVIHHLVSQGIHQIAINIHHHGEQIREILGDGTKFNASLHYSYENHLLDSGGGVRTALELIPGDGAIAIHNADIMAAIDINNLAKVCPTHGCTLALIANPKHNNQGDFSLQHSTIKQQHTNPYTFTGVSVWQPSALLKYPSNTNFSLITPIQELIAKHQCAGVVHTGHWFDIGRPRDLIQANRYYRKESL